MLGVYSLIVWGFSQALEARLRGSVEFPCEMQQGGHPVEELLIYWQRERDNALVAGAWHGKVNTDKQDENYRGRASLSPSRLTHGDFTLRLSDLSLQDSGTYFCMVFWTKLATILLLNNTTELHVMAEYSTPVLTSAAPTERSPELTLTCTTQGGTPQPEIRWVNDSDGTTIREDQIHNNIDQDEDFINVTSTITINVTSTTSFSCVILTASGNLTSNAYVLEVTGDNSDTERQHDVAPAVWNSIIVVVVILLIAGLVGILILKRRFLFPAGCSRQVEYQQGKAEI